MIWKICVWMMLLPVLIYADLNNELNKFFNQFGVSSHVDSAEIYNGQKAGYMTGGGFVTRNKVVNTQIASVNLPRFDAGCGGIDIFAGGFSFINHEQLIQTMKNIAGNAVGYSFLLGLETTSPQVSNMIKQLQTWSNNINSLGINSCETASTLVGAVWPKQTAAKQQICRSVAGKTGLFSDYVAGRQKCSQPEEFEQTMSKLAKDPQYADVLKEEYNIAWNAIQKHPYLAKNTQMAELFMSLTGTVIVRKEDTLVIEPWPALIGDESFLQALVEGGSTAIYRCSNSKDKQCLNLVKQHITIDSSKSWLGEVKKSLINMQNQILADQEISDADKQLLAKSKLPLYKIVNVMTAHHKGPCPINLYQVSEVVAMDLLLQTLREVIEVVRAGVMQLLASQMYDFNIKEYLEQLDRIEDTVRYYELRISQQMEREFQMMLKIERLEEQIASEIMLW